MLFAGLLVTSLLVKCLLFRVCSWLSITGLSNKCLLFAGLSTEGLSTEGLFLKKHDYRVFVEREFDYPRHVVSGPALAVRMPVEQGLVDVRGAIVQGADFLVVRGFVGYGPSVRVHEYVDSGPVVRVRVFVDYGPVDRVHVFVGSWPFDRVHVFVDSGSVVRVCVFVPQVHHIFNYLNRNFMGIIFIENGSG